LSQLTATLAKPWSDFLKAIDNALSQEVSLTCIGGFVLSALYALPRATGDIAYLEVTPRDAIHEVEAIGGHNSALAKRYGLALQNVGGIADPPEEYRSRLKELGTDLRKLRLSVLDSYDLLLTKLTRNSPKDREDAKYLIGREKLEFTTFYARWEREMAPWIGNRERHELTAQLWKEYFPEK
jgi:Nucleotidyltransferase of unknown function (DUF6036)